MKLKSIVNVLAPIFLFLIIISVIRHSSITKLRRDISLRFSGEEGVVYLSEINDLVTAVMLYGVTNGITFQGTNYVFVVEDVGPATSPGPVVPSETTFHFSAIPDETYLIEGDINTVRMAELGLYSTSREKWTKKPTSVEIGSAVISIGSCAFIDCTSLTSVTIPNSVTSIGSSAFIGCSNLMSLTMFGKTKATVQGMSNYSWNLPSGCVIHCTDGDITL